MGLVSGGGECLSLAVLQPRLKDVLHRSLRDPDRNNQKNKTKSEAVGVGWAVARLFAYAAEAISIGLYGLHYRQLNVRESVRHRQA